MKKIYVLLLGTLLLFGCAESSSYSPTPKSSISPTVKAFNEANTEFFPVTKVIDGDTLQIDNDGVTLKVRMIGIDATEVTGHECFSNEATNKLKELIGNNKVVLEADESQGDVDKYTRALRYVFLPNGTNLNLELIKQGYVHEYTYNKPYKYQQEFKAVEKQAREGEMGLWASNACGQENITPTPVIKTVTPAPLATAIINPTAIPTKIITKSPTYVATPTPKRTITSQPTTTGSSGFVCNCSKTCTQITTCAEAYFQLNNCGCSVRDKDKDGIPCDEMCQ